MAFEIQYKPLFEVKVFHQFFLNKGIVEFRNMNDSEKEKQLKNYNLSSILNIVPTTGCTLKLKGHQLVFRNSANGFTIWSKVTGLNADEPFIALADDLDLTFLMQIKHPLFLNFTDLKPENSRETYYLSNQRLLSEPNNFPLIDKAGGNKNLDKDFILSEDGKAAELKKLAVAEKKNLFGLIRIFIKADTGSLNITNAQNKIPEPSQSFEINLKNRNTIWRYFFTSNQQVTGIDDLKKENGNARILISRSEQPLTQNGFVSLKLNGTELPNPDARLIKPNASNNKYYSEIYM